MNRPRIGVTTSLNITDSGAREQRLDLAYVRAVERAGGLPLIVPMVATDEAAEAFAALADPDFDASVSAYDAAYSSAATPRDCTTLLDAIWTDRAASAASCEFIRQTMRKQVFTSRLASGFPFRRVSVAGKTGTLVAVRNEIGVIEFPGEVPIAVAVFTMSARSEMALPEVDRAIGEVARVIVTELRRPDD